MLGIAEMLGMTGGTGVTNFSNLSIFTQESADIKLAYFQLAVSWVKVDEFEKFKIMVVRLDLMMERN